MGRRVLVVEDEPHLREAVAEALALEGFSVTEAARSATVKAKRDAARAAVRA